MAEWLQRPAGRGAGGRSSRGSGGGAGRSGHDDGLGRLLHRPAGARHAAGSMRRCRPASERWSSRRAGRTAGRPPPGRLSSSWRRSRINAMSSKPRWTSRREASACAASSCTRRRSLRVSRRSPGCGTRPVTLAGAQEAIDEACTFAPGPAGLLNPIPVQRARLMLARGELGQVGRLDRRCRGTGRRRSVLPARAGASGARPGSCWRKGVPDQALALLGSAAMRPPSASSAWGASSRSRALRALAYQASTTSRKRCSHWDLRCSSVARSATSGCSSTKGRRWPTCSRGWSPAARIRVRVASRSPASPASKGHFRRRGR